MTRPSKNPRLTPAQRRRRAQLEKEACVIAVLSLIVLVMVAVSTYAKY